jgi:NNP family nitrate/nitrite transporter-like MFS transporter
MNRDAASPESDLKAETFHGQSWSAAAPALALLTTIGFFNFSGRVVFAPLVPEIEKSLVISHAEAGSLFFFVSAGYFVSLVCSGWVAARLEHRKTIIVSSVGVGLALAATSLGDSLAAMRIELLVLGAAAGLYLPSAIATLADLIRPDHWGKAMAVHELAPNLGLVAVPLVAEWIMSLSSWRAVPVVLGACAAMLGMIYARAGRGGRFPGQVPKISSVRVFLKDPAFLLVTALFALGISSTLGIYTMLPVYLVSEHGFARPDANLFVALSRVSGLFMALAGGWAADRFGPFRTMAVIFLVTGISTVALGLAPGRWVLAVVFVQPLLAVCFFPAGFSALSRIGPPASRNIAVSLAVPAAFMFGAGVVPGVIGLCGDVASFSLGIVLVGFLVSGGGAVALRLRRLGAAPGRE